MTDAPVKAPAEEFVFVDAGWSLHQSYRRDPLQAPFFAALKDKRLLGVRDPASGRVLFPPRSFAEESYSALSELVPVGPGGVIRTLTRVPGRKDGPPLLVVFVQLDGAGSAAAGRLKGAAVEMENPLPLIGARCRAVFVDAPAGGWADFWYELEG
jgi:uncharacterized OB-fold protein